MSDRQRIPSIAREVGRRTAISLGLAVAVMSVAVLLSGLSPAAGTPSAGLPTSAAEWVEVMDTAVDACLRDAGFDYSSSFSARNSKARAEGVPVLLPVPSSDDYARADAFLLNNGYGYFADQRIPTPKGGPPLATAEANEFLSQLAPAERETFLEDWARCRSAAAASIPFPEFERQSEAALLEDEALRRFSSDHRVKAARQERLSCMADLGFDLGASDVPTYIRDYFKETTGLEYDESGPSAVDEETLERLRTFELSLAEGDVECQQAMRAVYVVVSQEIEAEILAENPEFAEAVDVWLFGE